MTVAGLGLDWIVKVKDGAQVYDARIIEIGKYYFIGNRRQRSNKEG